MKKPPVYISMTRREGVIYSTALLGVGIACLYGMRYMESEMAVTGMFLLGAVFLFIAGTGIYSLVSKQFFYGKYEYEVMVTKTELTITEKITGKQDVLPWNELRKLATWTRLEGMGDGTNDKVYTYHWCFEGVNGAELSFPFYSKGREAFVERIKLLPGLDRKKLEAATSGTKEGFITVWERKA